GHKGGVTSADFSLDGMKIVTSSMDATARLWDASTGREITVLRGHDSFVMKARFSPDGMTVLTSARTESTRLWDWRSGEPLVTVMQNTWLTDAAFSRDGRQFLTMNYDGARVWQLRRGQDLIDYACSIMSRPLTYAQRDEYFLPHEPKNQRCGRPPSKEEPT